jgi:hypothetical protein
VDTRRSFYLASRQDDFDLSPPDEDRVSTDIPYLVSANDNVRTKDRLSARCAALFRRLIALRSLK